MADKKKRGLGETILDLLLGSEEPEPLPINEEEPWLTELEPTPEPSPTPILVIPPTAEEQAESIASDPASYLAEQLIRRREKLLPLQYIANPPPKKK